jgi:hypothetical protein
MSEVETRDFVSRIFWDNSQKLLLFQREMQKSQQKKELKPNRFVNILQRIVKVT